MRYHTLATHPLPHLDEILAIWLLRKFGEAKFPAVSTAKIEYWNADTQKSLSAEDCEKQGILLLGIGGGRFDEHPTTTNEAKDGECCATLVAKELCVNTSPALNPILKYVKNSDLYGGQPFDIASTVKVIYTQFPDNPEKVMEWAITAIEAKYQEQLNFLTVSRTEFERAAQIEDVDIEESSCAMTVKMATIVSDDAQVAKLARSEHGCGAAVVIQKQSSGNVQIYFDKRAGLRIDDVVRIIRLEEQGLKSKVVVTDWKFLEAADGKIDGVEEWYYHKKGQMLLNGSLTAQNVQPTKIPLERIQEIVRIGLNSGAFEPGRAAECSKGNCASTAHNQCPWYKLGLIRCRGIRFRMQRR